MGGIQHHQVELFGAAGLAQPLLSALHPRKTSRLQIAQQRLLIAGALRGAAGEPLITTSIGARHRGAIVNQPSSS